MKFIIAFVPAFVLLLSCQRNIQKTSLDGANVQLEIKRLDKDLNIIGIDSLEKEIGFLKEKYGDFFGLYCDNVLLIGEPGSANFAENLKLFLTDYTVFHALSKTMEKFGDFDDIGGEIENGFRHYKYFFPEKQIPAVYTIITGFNQSIVVDEGVLAISLDKYLGRDCEIYDRLMVSNYMRQNMHPRMIPSDCMKAWALTEYPNQDPIDDLIGNMLYNGKIHYFQKCMLPNAHDTLIMGFTKQQADWCEQYEKQM